MKRSSHQHSLSHKEFSTLAGGYGGSLMTKRKGRSYGRPISTKHTMHLVLRSSKASGPWSFRKSQNEKMIYQLAQKFGQRFAVRIVSLANVGNHLHFQLQVTKRHLYKPFIRALTAAIAIRITGVSRWTNAGAPRLKFWDYRPYTRIVNSFKYFLNLKDYLQINQWEGLGTHRQMARVLISKGILLKEFSSG
jgi:hypothetical protein